MAALISAPTTPIGRPGVCTVNDDPSDGADRASDGPVRDDVTRRAVDATTPLLAVLTASAVAGAASAAAATQQPKILRVRTNRATTNAAPRGRVSALAGPC